VRRHGHPRAINREARQRRIYSPAARAAPSRAFTSLRPRSPLLLFRATTKHVLGATLGTTSERSRASSLAAND